MAVNVEDWSQDGLAGRRIVTPHFEVMSTLCDREFEAALPKFLECAYERYEKTLPASDHVMGKLTVYLFAFRPQWEKFTKRHFPTGYDTYTHIHAGGYTEGDTSVLFFTDRATTLATLAHEGWHQYVSAAGVRGMPAWLNEGLACYHEAVQCGRGGTSFTPQDNNCRIGHLRDAVQRDRLLSLRELANTDVGEVIRHDNSNVTQTYYAQVWALVTFLRHGAGLRNAAAFDRMLRDLAEGKFASRVSASQLAASSASGCSTAEAVFRTYFGCTPEQLDKSYYDHLVRVAGF